MKKVVIGILSTHIVKEKDNVIEAIELKDKDNFILGVQFHPEVLEDNDLFCYFINYIKEYK